MDFNEKLKNQPSIELNENEFELPVGYRDSDGNVHKVIRMKEMTGEVEEALGEKAVRANFSKYTTALIANVVDTIGDLKMSPKIARELKTADRDFVALANYLTSLGETIENDDVCPNCGEKLTVIHDLTEAIKKTRYLPAEVEPVIKISGLPNGFTKEDGTKVKEMYITLADGVLQDRIFSKNNINTGEVITHTLSYCTVKIPGIDKWNLGTFKKLSTRDRKYISEQIAKVKIGMDLDKDVDCIECGNTFKSSPDPRQLMGE